MKPTKPKLETIAAPGSLIPIGDIPTALINEHNEAFYYLWAFGIKDADVLDIDAHSDTSIGIMLKDADISAEDLPGDYYQKLTSSNYMCAAVYSGMVSSIHWYNPHARIKLTDIGSTKKSKNRKIIQTFAGKDIDGGYAVVHYRLGGPGERIVSQRGFKLRSPSVINIELDAFCCHRNIERVPDSYKGVRNYTSRIRKIIDFLKTLRRPDLIMITRAQSRDSGSTFVPEDKVDSVQKHLIKGLKGIYER